MQTNNSTGGNKMSGRIDEQDLTLAWSEAPWDSRLFGFPVVQIEDIQLKGPNPQWPFQKFSAFLDEVGCRFVSCRLHHHLLRESMFLESQSFRFIEMVYQPSFENLQSFAIDERDNLVAGIANADDLSTIATIAAKAFSNERFHVDPRISPELGNLRYKNWALNSYDHQSQRLYVIRDAGNICGFFVTELLPDSTFYWHLNAIDPAAQGRGLGKRAWRSMMAVARDNGAERVASSIVARNHRVLNLYARLGFRFSTPSMTFHWMR